MRRRINTEGVCNAQRHYMVNLGERLERIGRIIWHDAGVKRSFQRIVVVKLHNK